jgi:glycosyltransferase involved in cell wall biosynthesis
MSRRLLVLYSSHSPVCGIGTWLESLTEHLAPHGWEVVVGLSWGKTFHDPAAVEKARPGLKTVRLDGRTGTRAGRWQAIDDVVRNVRPDVAMVTLLDDGLRALASARSKGDVRLAVANHGNAPEHLATILELHQQLDLAVTVNRASYEVLANWPGASWPDGVLNYISNAVPLPPSVRAPRDHLERMLRIGFVGRLSADKGAEQLPAFCEAMKQANVAFELWVVGDGPERPAIERLAKDYPGVVTYFGPMFGRDLQKRIFPMLDIVLCLSPSEGWPMSIGEGMAHGAIPVSSEFTGIHAERVIRHEETGLIFPYGETAAAAAAIGRLIADADLRQRLSSAAAREIRENFSGEKFGRDWAACLNRCIATQPKAGPREPSPPELRTGARIKEQVRRWLRREVPHASIRSEWPVFRPVQADLVARVKTSLSSRR